jgi:hypothetical protein
VSNNIRHLELIRDILKFVVPTGYTVTINEVSITPLETTITVVSDVVFDEQPEELVSKVTNDKPGIVTSEVGQTGVFNGEDNT